MIGLNCGAAGLSDDSVMTLSLMTQADHLDYTADARHDKDMQDP